MCGISGIFGRDWNRRQLQSMVALQRHRGPDDEGIFIDPSEIAGIGHNRLSIIDLTSSGHQPMADRNECRWITFNGEIYNYVELRSQLKEYPYRGQSDTEVILAAYERWGPACLDRLIGMFAFVIWDSKSREMFAARDRFGVKPLYYSQLRDGTLFVASEIKALRSLDNPSPDPTSWATYLTCGAMGYSNTTFWQGIHTLPPGHCMSWKDGQVKLSRWYDLADRVGERFDGRPIEEVQEECVALLRESVALRFRSDVPVGINLSGGLDSSALLGLVQAVQGPDSRVDAFTFVTGDDRYDELPWVRQMLAHTSHQSVVCTLTPSQVPALAGSVQYHQDEPFGGLPTLAYARIFEEARARGTIVLLDGQGLDEQWAGYDYYNALAGIDAGIVQGTRSSPVRPECLIPDFRALSQSGNAPAPFPDVLRNLQYRDIYCTKMPRALRYNDRVSMRASTELREPFLDHRLFELALRQRPQYKLVNGTGKWLIRQIARKLLPESVVEAPKRPLQTPQREWLRGPLRQWAADCIEQALAAYGGSWLDPAAVRATWSRYCDEADDNSFYIWQWISVGLVEQAVCAPSFQSN
jgi:asparagine synthase (glutamine-hydrolysing)